MILKILAVIHTIEMVTGQDYDMIVSAIKKLKILTHRISCPLVPVLAAGCLLCGQYSDISPGKIIKTVRIMNMSV